MRPTPPVREVQFRHGGRDFVAMLHAYDEELGAHECSIVELVGDGEFEWITCGMYAKRFAGPLPRNLRKLRDSIARALGPLP